MLVVNKMLPKNDSDINFSSFHYKRILNNCTFIQICIPFLLFLLVYAVYQNSVINTGDISAHA